MNAPPNHPSHSAGAGRPGIYSAIVGLVALALGITFLIVFTAPSRTVDVAPVAVTPAPNPSFHAPEPMIPPPNPPAMATASPAPNVILPIPAPPPMMPPSPPKAELGDAIRIPRLSPQTNQGRKAPMP